MIAIATATADEGQRSTACDRDNLALTVVGGARDFFAAS